MSGEFEPEYKAQVEPYLRWFNKYERMENEEAPIKWLCKSSMADERKVKIISELMQLDEEYRSWIQEVGYKNLEKDIE